MKAKRFFFMTVVLLLPFNLHAADRLMFGINPGAYGSEDQWVLRDSFQPLADYIGKAAGTQVRTDITQSFKTIDAHAGKGRYDLLMGPTNVIAEAYKVSGFNPVAKFKDLASVLLVREPSPYKTVASLKGSRIGMVSRKTLIGQLAAHLLQSEGVMLNRDFKQVQEINFQDTLVSLLLENSVDVISVGPKVAGEALKAHPGKLRILAKADPVPGFAISLARDMPPEQAKKITEALVTIGDSASGKAALAAITVGGGAGNTHLTKTSSAEYVKTMELIGAAKNLYPAQAK
ncbi:periplasmic binding protein-related protein [Sulfuriferula multivorans]|uniref:Periplasmic binding protein-related protein n=1 Tax=Sulfuriferula multivorans TaxID=1559896 RepID=A0A401JG07_9PROT|nr:PhnD/SsuA/transferrin family substrate-binding protein [Sulfuriferula multivorans]GBL46560.1 periplasmic binding protein-related protein [Sulfuriferula multivorans]